MKLKYGLLTTSVLLIAATTLAQSIDETRTTQLRQELDRSGVKYSKAVCYAPPSQTELSQMPPVYRGFLTNGMTVLDMRNQKGIDLKLIGSLPITHLSLERTDVADLSPLKNLPLVQVGLRCAPVRDISVLRGKQLYQVDLRETKVTDISPLEGMPIEQLDLTFTAVSNVEVIAKMPRLNTLFLSYTMVKDLQPLKTVKQLRRLYLPDEIDSGLDDVRQMTWLTHLAYGDSDFLPVQDFWKKYDAGQLKPSGRKWAPKTEPSAAPLPSAPQTGPSEGAR